MIENKKNVEGMTKVFEDMGVPKEAVHIVIMNAKKQLGNRRKVTFRKHAQTTSL